MTINKNEYFRRFCTTRTIREKEKTILDFCRGKTVLDVGCVGQDLGPEDPAWQHNRLQSVCGALHGVDINSTAIDNLHRQGYQVWRPDQMDPQRHRYDVIVMADVIEHVDNPVEFLRFYHSFLTEQGSMIVTTPNPFSARQFVTILASNTVSVNLEHTFWLDPKTFTEVVRRSGLAISDFYWLQEYLPIKPRGIRSRFYLALARFLIRCRRYYSPNLMFILTKES